MTLRTIPVSLKIAVALFVAHIALYAGAMFLAYSNGWSLQPLWFFHLFASTFLATRIPRQKKGGHTTIIFYCVVIPVIMLRNEYLAIAEPSDGLSVMYKSLVIFAPLLFAAAAVFVGRQYYLSPTPAPSDSSQSNA